MEISLTKSLIIKLKHDQKKKRKKEKKMDIECMENPI